MSKRTLGKIVLELKGKSERDLEKVGAVAVLVPIVTIIYRWISSLY